MNNEASDQGGEHVVQVVIFTLDNEKYGVAIGEAREVIKDFESSPVPGSPAFIVGVMNLRGQVIPIIDLEKLFGLHRTTPAVTRGPLIVVDDAQGKLFGIQVDRVVQIIKVPKDTIKPAPTMVAAKISPDYVDGVIVSSASNATNEGSEVALLLSLQKIVTQKVVSEALNNPNQGTISIESQQDQPQEKEEVS